MQKLRLLTVLAVAAFLIPATSASALKLCVQQGALPATPCPAVGFDKPAYMSLGAALVPGQAEAGDTVRVEPGTYPEQVAFGGRQNVTIFGDPVGPRPLITFGAAAGDHTFLVNQNANGTTLRHLEIDQTNANPTSVALETGTSGGAANSDVVLDDVVLKSTGICGRFFGNVTATAVSGTSSGASCLALRGAGTSTITASDLSTSAQQFGIDATTGTTVVQRTAAASPGGVAISSSNQMTLNRVTATGATGVSAALSQLNVTNSLLRSTGENGHALLAGTSATVTLRNVTAIATGTGSVGVTAGSGSGTAPAGSSVQVTNSIVRGAGTHDLEAVAAHPGCFIPSADPLFPLSVPCQAGTLTAKRTNYRTTAGDNVTDGGANQAGDPKFVGATDFHLQTGSPAIDAGDASAVPAGDVDLDGAPRPTAGTAPDLGAYEKPTAVVPPTATATATATAAGTPAPSATATVTATPTVTAPSNAFKVMKVKASRAGTITVTLTLPGPGQVTVRARKFGGRTAGSDSGGKVVVRLKPNKKARKARRKHALKVKLAITFTPTGGVAAKQTAKVKVSRRRRG